MKKCYLTLLVLLISVAAECQTKTTEVKYRRSSLHTILVESDDYPLKNVVMAAYNKAPFPDKYNDHLLPERTVNPKNYPITEADRKAYGKVKTSAQQDLKNVMNKANGKAEDQEGNDTPIIIDKYIKESKLANRLVGKWFNRKPDGTMDMNLIGERGMYNATEMEANIAKGSARGSASLADAGEELIHNTFVVFSKLNFVSNEIAAAATRDMAKNMAKVYITDTAQLRAANKAADASYEMAKQGYSIWTYSYLYQLEWNEETAANFYNTLWMDSSKIDSTRRIAFDKSDIFKLTYLGSENATSVVMLGKDQENIIERGTLRNSETVIHRLQKKYEPFKVKIPLYTGEPITAKIGMKEGLTGGEKFEVLEQVQDPATGKTKYNQVGKISVDKKLIWDNRFVAGQVPKTDSTKLDRTTFKGDAGKYYSGMLIRQLNTKALFK